MPHHTRGRHDNAILDIVGDVEQRLDEDPVGGDPLFHHVVARAGARHQLRQKPAFRAGRNNHRVLHLLRFAQPENLGAEILRPIRPANAAARNRREAHVHAFDARTVDPNLAKGARLRRTFDKLGIEFEGYGVRQLAVCAKLVEVGAQCHADQVQVRTQDAVLVQTLHLGERTLDPHPDGHFELRPLLERHLAGWVEPDVEQLDKVPSHPGMTVQRVRDVTQSEWRTDLAHIGGIRPHYGNVAPASAGDYDQPVESVVVGLAANDGEVASLHTLVDVAEVDRRAVRSRQHHVMQCDFARTVRKMRMHAIASLVYDGEAKVLQYGYAIGQRDRLIEAVDGGPHP